MKHIFRLSLATVVSVCFGGAIAAIAVACSSSTARAQTAPDIYHRDFGETTCYYTISATTGDVGTLSCVK